MPQNKRGQRGPTVLHVSQPSDGGVARVVTDLVRHQTEAGMRVYVACPPGGVLTEAATEAGAHVLLWHADRQPGLLLPQEISGVRRLVRRFGPDLVHAHSAKAGLAVRLALRGRTPTVFQPHAWSFDAVDGPAARLALRWERHATRWAHRVLCVSEDERQRGQLAGVDGPWAVVRNGIDTEHYRPADEVARERARARLAALHGVPVDAPLAVCVGRLCRQKGQDLLLRAWPAVTEAVPDARLVLVGEGPQRDTLRDEAPEHVVFAGESPDPVLWYTAADLVVLPSRWEGMALVPLEAMASGRPVVVTDVTGARESLPVDHIPDCLVPPEDPGALARAVSTLLDDPGLRGVLGFQGRHHIRARYDVRRTADEVARLYDELLSGEPVEDAAPRQAVVPGAARVPADRSALADRREHVGR